MPRRYLSYNEEVRSLGSEVDEHSFKGFYTRENCYNIYDMIIRENHGATTFFKTTLHLSLSD